MNIRTILKISIIILSIISCKNLEKDERSKFKKIIEKELKSGIRNDTIFLDYIFKMSKDDFEQKTKELRKENKIYVNNSNNLAYKMTISDDIFGKDLEATFSPTYHNDKLYKLGVSVIPNVGGNNELTQLQLVSLFNDKYGFYDYSEKSIVDDSDNYYWIDGNRQIEILSGLNDARIFYTDLIIEKETKELEESKRKTEIEKAKNDF